MNWTRKRGQHNGEDAFFSINKETGKLDYVSSSIESILGFTSEEVIEMGTNGLETRVPDEYRAKMADFAAESKQEKLPKIFKTYV